MLTAGDQKLYKALCSTARLGHPCPTVDELADFMRVSSLSSPVAALVRLEQAGMIRIRRYQKHRVVTICATGDSTAQPDNPKTHWRDRPLGAASAALKLVPESEVRIRELAVIHERALPDMIADIMKAGLAKFEKRSAAA